MSGATISHSDDGPITLITIRGYYNAEAGETMEALFDTFLKERRMLFALDFSTCETANSPGVASLMDLCLKVVDDYRGKIAIFGLDPLKDSFFTMVGIFKVATKATSLDVARKTLGG